MFLETPRTGVDNIYIDRILLVDGEAITPSPLKTEEEILAEDSLLLV